jgi:hypothetical protein
MLDYEGFNVFTVPSPSMSWWWRQQVGELLPDYTVLQPRRQPSSPCGVMFHCIWYFKFYLKFTHSQLLIYVTFRCNFYKPICFAKLPRRIFICVCYFYVPLEHFVWQQQRRVCLILEGTTKHIKINMNWAVRGLASNHVARVETVNFVYYQSLH